MRRQLRMAAAALPFAGGQPDFMEQKPLDRPGHDRCRRSILIGIQASSFGSYRQSAGKPACSRGDRHAAAARRCRAGRRRSADRGRNADIGVGEPPLAEHAPPEVDDADAVGLADRAERPLPDPDPVGVERQPKLREEAPDFGVLLIDRLRHACSLTVERVPRRRPRGRCSDRCRRPSAGMLPVRGMCSELPVRRRRGRSARCSRGLHRARPLAEQFFKDVLHLGQRQACSSRWS